MLVRPVDSFLHTLELVATLTGVIYVVLEILQRRSMWYVGIVTGAACALSFALTHVWASMLLNMYYTGMSFVGLARWKKAAGKSGEGVIRLERMSARVWIQSGFLAVAGTSAMFFVLRFSGDSAPFLDALAAILSVIATWWLTRVYLPQWILWIVADIISTALCISTGNIPMALLYAVYAASAVYGYFYWKRKGQYGV